MVNRDIHRGVVFRLSADDQWRSGFINQNGVHFVDDGEVQAALNAVFDLINHVVTQVIEAVFVIGSVGDVSLVGGLLFFTGNMRSVDADRQAEEGIQLPHPTGISASKVIIHGDDVDTFTCECIQVHRQRGG